MRRRRRGDRAASRDLVEDVDELLARFRGLGDVRCVTRSLLLRARLADTAASHRAPRRGVRRRGGRERPRPPVTIVLKRLVDAHWASGDRMATLAALDRLAEVAGEGEAAAACPPELTDELAAARPLLASRQP